MGDEPVSRAYELHNICLSIDDLISAFWIVDRLTSLQQISLMIPWELQTTECDSLQLFSEVFNV